MRINLIQSDRYWSRQKIGALVISGLLLSPVGFTGAQLSFADANVQNRERERADRERGGQRPPQERDRGEQRPPPTQDRERERQVERDRERQRGEQERQRGEQERQRQAEQERQRNAERERERQRDQDRQRDQERQRQAEQERQRNAERERERQREQDRQRDQERQRQAEQERQRNAEREREKQREQERERLERERERERHAERERERQRLERERERQRAEEERRRHAEKEREKYRRDERRRAERDNWRREYEREQRRIRRGERREIRDDLRWDERLRRWVNKPYRPIAPRPIRRIILPLPFPEIGFWDYKQIMDTSDSLEYHVQALYREMERELSSNNRWNDEALSEMYDVVEAARIYSDSLEKYDYTLRSSLYELFNLEEELLEAELYIEQGRLSSYVRENFAVAKYYVQELLWTYHYNIRDFDDRRDRHTGQYMVVSASSLNFRYAPSTDSNSYVCGQLPKGLKVKMLSTLSPKDNYYKSKIYWAELEVDADIRRYVTNPDCKGFLGSVYVSLSHLR